MGHLPFSGYIFGGMLQSLPETGTLRVETWPFFGTSWVSWSDLGSFFWVSKAALSQLGMWRFHRLFVGAFFGSIGVETGPRRFA